MNHQNYTIATPSKLFFLYGILFIPFFNDFPLLLDFSNIFRTPSLVFFIMSFIFLFIEKLIATKEVFFFSKKQLFLLIGMILFIWLSFLFNIERSASIVGSNTTGEAVMQNLALATSVKILLLLMMIHMINTIDINIIAKYIKIGFIFSVLYTFMEILFVILPNYFGMNPIDIFDLIEKIIHYRQRIEVTAYVIGIDPNRARGLAFEPSYQAMVLIFLLPFIISLQDKYRLYKVSWSIAMLSTFSLTGCVASIIFLIFYKYSGFRLLFINLIFLFALIFITYVLITFNIVVITWEQFGSIAIRVGSWVSAIKAISMNLFFGTGPGMSSYWVIFHYPDFFWTSFEASSWYASGKENISAATFSSILSFLLDYGILPVLFLILFFAKTKIFNYIFKTPIARASIVSMFIASFGIDTYSFLGYSIFFALTLSKKWHLLYYLDTRNNSKLDLINKVYFNNK